MLGETPTHSTYERHRSSIATQCGAVMAEFAIATSVLAVLLVFMINYIAVYNSYNEQAQVQESLAVGRMSIIPPFELQTGSAAQCAASDATFLTNTTMYLNSAFTLRGANCEENGDFRFSLVRATCQDELGVCVLEDDLEFFKSSCEFTTNHQAIDCNGNVTSDTIDQAIIQQVEDYARSSYAGKTLNIGVAFSHQHPEFGAILSNLDM